MDFEVDQGEVVSIIDGPFSGQSGEVKSIDVERFKLTVMVEMFGRETPVEVEFDQIEKI